MTAADASAPIWKALSDSTRRRILDLLRGGPRTTGEIAGAFPELSRFAVMKHLGLLERANLVLVRRQGRERWNHLNATPLREVYERWVTQLEDRWAASILQIGRLAEQREGNASMIDTDRGPAVRTIDIVQRYRIEAGTATVFSMLTDRTGEWWHQPHRLFDDEARIVVEARPGGMIGEILANGDFGAWGTIVKFEAGKTLSWSGQMGMSSPAYNLVRFDLEDENGTTVLNLTHKGFGMISEHSQTNYQVGWEELMQRMIAAIAA